MVFRAIRSLTDPSLSEAWARALDSVCPRRGRSGRESTPAPNLYLRHGQALGIVAPSASVGR